MGMHVCIALVYNYGLVHAQLVQAMHMRISLFNAILARVMVMAYRGHNRMHIYDDKPC